MIDQAQRFKHRIPASRREMRLPTDRHRTPSTAPEPTTNGPGERRRSVPLGSGESQRAQLRAAAASLVWFAGWFQAIYDEIAGEAREERRE